MNNEFLKINGQKLLSMKGKLVFLKNGREYFDSAHEKGSRIKLKISLPRMLSASSVEVEILNENSDYMYKADTSVAHTEKHSVDNFIIDIKTGDLEAGLYFLTIKIKTVIGYLYCSYHSGEISFFRQKSAILMPQIIIFEKIFEKPLIFNGGILYHIFVDRFYRGDSSREIDGEEYVRDWYSEIPEYPEYPGAPIRNRYFYGGTLKGVKDKLSYIASLGVNIIYLSPIFSSPSNHKYDTSDYMKIDRSFGDESDLIALIDEAKKYGIGLLLDGVFNHTGDNSVYFNKYASYSSLGAYQSKKSQYYPWYDFKEFPHRYTSWWDIDILPRINPDEKSCRDFFTGPGGVIEKYAKCGILGFRLDVADELSDDFIFAIKKRLCFVNPNSLLYGEVWEDASNKIAYGKRKHYYLGRELDGVMNYPLRAGIISYLTNKSTDEIKYALTDIIFNAPKHIRDMQMNILGSHDTQRILTALSGKNGAGMTNREKSTYRMSSEEYESAKARLMTAYIILASLPGIASIYYGDEVGMEGYSDPFNRRAFPWGKEDGELLRFYRAIGNMRRHCKIFESGKYALIYLDRDLLLFKRYDARSAYVTAVNNSDDDILLTFSIKAEDIISNVKDYKFIIKRGKASIIKAPVNTRIEIQKI